MELIGTNRLEHVTHIAHSQHVVAPGRYYFFLPEIFYFRFIEDESRCQKAERMMEKSLFACISKIEYLRKSFELHVDHLRIKSQNTL